MTKAHWITEAAARTGMPRPRVERVARRLLAEFEGLIVAGCQIELRGLGRFWTELVPAHRRWMPKSRDYRELPAERKVRFKMSRKLRKDMNP